MENKKDYSASSQAKQELFELFQKYSNNVSLVPGNAKVSAKELKEIVEFEMVGVDKDDEEAVNRGISKIIRANPKDFEPSVSYKDINDELEVNDDWLNITSDNANDYSERFGISSDELMKHLLSISPIQAANVFGKDSVDNLMDINVLLDNLNIIKSKLGSDPKSSDFVDMTIQYLTEVSYSSNMQTVKKTIASEYYEALIGAGEEVASNHPNLKTIHGQLKKMSSAYVKTESKSV